MNTVICTIGPPNMMWPRQNCLPAPACIPLTCVPLDCCKIHYTAGLVPPNRTKAYGRTTGRGEPLLFSTQMCPILSTVRSVRSTLSLTRILYLIVWNTVSGTSEMRECTTYIQSYVRIDCSRLKKKKVARSRTANCRHVFHVAAPHDLRSGTVVIHLEDPAANDFVVSTGLQASYSCVTSTSNRLMQTEVVSKKNAVQSTPSMSGNREMFAP